MSESDNPCVYTLIFMITVLAISWPLYGYFIFKWYQHRNHFVLRNRWPKISTAIIILTIIMQLLSIIDALLCIKELAAISMGICNMISGLVFYRAQLVYLRCLATRKYLSEYMASQNRSIHIKSTQSKGCCYIWTKLILFISIVCSLSIILMRYLHNDKMMVPILFTLSLFIGIISLFNILHKKVTDSIGISKECSVQISCMFIMIVFSPFFGSIVPPYIEINYWAGVIIVTLYGFVTLFVGLHLIQKNTSKFIYNRSTKNIQLQTQPSIPSMLAPPSINIPTDSITINTRSVGLSVINKPPSTPHILDASVQLQLQNVSSESLRKSLQQFIKNDIDNYSLFVGYLCECFALENLMFLERAIILYHAIVKYQQKDVQFQNAHSQQNNKLYHESCYKLQFNYLNEIHSDIDNMIQNSENININSNNQNTNHMRYKQGIVKIMQVLHTQFCRYDSETEINVSYATQGNIRQLFENKTEQQILQQFKSYNDLLIVFHYAIVECWLMCQSVYGFQFKSYVRKNKQKRRLSVPQLDKKITNDF
eukprot:44312_1